MVGTNHRGGFDGGGGWGEVQRRSGAHHVRRVSRSETARPVREPGHEAARRRAPQPGITAGKLNHSHELTYMRLRANNACSRILVLTYICARKKNRLSSGLLER